ncbi:MAG: hypothetical protein GC182_10745 [Rhodopseudomonas sp.]|nr:hypothetical protein [Rhodopseudomonas sp.]
MTLPRGRVILKVGVLLLCHAQRRRFSGTLRPSDAYREHVTVVAVVLINAVSADTDDASFGSADAAIAAMSPLPDACLFAAPIRSSWKARLGA